MKNALKLLTALVLLTAASLPAFAHEKGLKAGPNGGRVIASVEPHLEFFITADRQVQITALTDDLKPAKLGGQVISVTAGDRSKPTKLEFKKEGGKLISTNTIPNGNDFPVSVSIKADAKAKATYEKFNLNLSKCPDCKSAEYACTCHGEAEKKK